MCPSPVYLFVWLFPGYHNLFRCGFYLPRSSPGGGVLGRTAIVIGSVAASLACFQYLPERLWGLLVVVSTPTIFMVQVPQIAKNFRQRHTGELAGLTVLLAFIGSSIRIGTTIAVRDFTQSCFLCATVPLGACALVFVCLSVCVLFFHFFYRISIATERVCGTECVWVTSPHLIFLIFFSKSYLSYCVAFLSSPSWNPVDYRRKPLDIHPTCVKIICI